MPAKLSEFASGLRVRPYDPAEVTTVRPDAEHPAAAAGMEPPDVEAIWEATVDLYRTRLQPAIGLCVRRGGRVILDRTIGHARGNGPLDPPDAPVQLATPDTLFNLFSASKAFTAMVIHMLDERGYLHLDDPVAEYIPEFGRHGKDRITIRHVLTHRAGIPSVRGAEPDLDLMVDGTRVLEVICDVKPVWRPGRVLAYHALTGGFILGEVVRRVTGRGIREFLRETVLDPCAIENLDYGVTPEKLPRVAGNAFTGPRPKPPYNWLLQRALGVSMEAAAELSNDRRFLTAEIPAGNIIGTADEACRFFQLLLNGGVLDGVRVLAPATLRRAVAEQSYLELDMTLLLPVRYGMGFMLGTDRFSLYGPRTPRAFGHLGFTYLIVYADPERDLSVAIMTTGKPFVTPSLWRVYQLLWTIAERCPRMVRSRSRG